MTSIEERMKTKEGKLPTVSVSDGDTVFYNTEGAKIIHKDGTMDFIPSESLSLDEKVDCHYKFGKDQPIGSKDRAIYEEKKASFLAGWDACNSAREKELPLNFWNRLASFISNVQVNDLPGLEEQSMIMHTCEKMLAKEETKQ
jgi:hypothetical protein